MGGMSIVDRSNRIAIMIAGVAVLQSCNLGTHYFLDDQQLAEFEAAGPIVSEIDSDKILSGLSKPGLYRVVVGDLLEIHGPSTLFLDPSDPATSAGPGGGHVTRVDSKGAIVVPMVGTLDAKGKTLAEIEGSIVSAVFPKFVKRRPSIVARVSEYRTERVTVVGAVTTPGVVHLKSDELSLFSALQASGGILRPGQLVLGAKRIRIRRPGQKGAQGLLLPVKGLSLPVGDVVLKGGETIEVEPYAPDTFTVVGLVTRPGVYTRPPGAKFNLMNALATGGGAELISNPPYATVFRQDATGKILASTFEITGPQIVQALQLSIKRGDVVVVAHTAASWTRALMSQVLRLQVGYVANETTFD
jgi:polysaccharide biosynthesis/export protein